MGRTGGKGRFLSLDQIVSDGSPTDSSICPSRLSRAPTSCWRTIAQQQGSPRHGTLHMSAENMKQKTIAWSQRRFCNSPPPRHSRQGQATAAQGDNGEVDDYVTQIFNLFQVWAGGNENKPVCYEEAKEFFQVGFRAGSIIAFLYFPVFIRQPSSACTPQSCGKPWGRGGGGRALQTRQQNRPPSYDRPVAK